MRRIDPDGLTGAADARAIRGHEPSVAHASATMAGACASRLDAQRERLYVLDHIFWSGTMPNTDGHIAPVSRADWTAYATMLLDDGLARPYDHQIRRRRRAAPLPVTTHPEPMTAFAYLRSDRIEISDDKLQRWIALHENDKRPVESRAFITL